MYICDTFACMCMHTCTHVECMYMCIHMIHTAMNMHICTHVSTYIYIYIYIYIYMGVCIAICLSVCLSVCLSIYIYIYIYVCIHTKYRNIHAIMQQSVHLSLSRLHMAYSLRMASSKWVWSQFEASSDASNRIMWLSSPLHLPPHGGFLKQGYLQIIHFHHISQYKQFIWRYPHFRTPPHGSNIPFLLYFVACKGR